MKESAESQPAYFTWSDAWVFTSLYPTHKGEGQLELRNVVSMGDALNRAIFTAEELKNGFAKLIARGILEFSGIMMRLTPMGKEIAENAEKVKGGLFSRVDISLKVLNAYDLKLPVTGNAAGMEFVTDNTIRLAIDQYLGNTNQ